MLPPDTGPAPRAATSLVCVAAVTGAHGVRGAFKLRCFTAEPEGVAAYGPVHDAAGRPLFTVQIVARTQGGVIARAAGIADRDAAQALRGTRLHVPREKLPEPEADTFYHADLVGLEAVMPDGRTLGAVTAVHDYGAGDILEIACEDGGSTLLPFTREIVPEVDLARGRLQVVPPAELVAGPAADRARGGGER